MTISLSCDTCGRSYQLKDEAAGRKIRCKDCESILTVPELNAGFDDDDPWDDSSSHSSKQDDFWNSDDDDWGDSSTSSGAYSAPSAYSLQSRGTAPSTISTRPKKPKKKRPAGGSSGNAGALVGKIVGGLFVAIVVIGLIARVGGAIGKMDFGSSLSWEEFKPPGTPFAIQMPGKPMQSSQFQAGISITQFMIETRRPERAFGLMHASLPVPAGAIGGLSAADVDNVFRESKQGMILAAPGARVLSENKISVNDSAGNIHPGVELSVAMPYQGKQLQFVYRLFLVGSKMVITLAGAEERNFSDSKADFDKFLNSLNITQPVTPITSNGAGALGNPAGANGNDFTAPSDSSDFTQPPNFNPPPAGTSPNPGNPAADFGRKMQEDAERRRQESRERMERMRRESEERMRQIRERNQTPRSPGFP
ncbi:MAG TPA: hypothetical protein VMM56_02720 [Planctomycetaceae bacterium]|nr:hypothetical protein [Planctomycetaceae bacterium]